MVFINIFLKTLGLLFGISTFILLLGLLSNLFSYQNEEFIFVEGNKQSKNIIVTLELNGPIINNFDQSLLGNIIEYIDPIVVEKKLLSLNKINPKILIIKINSPGGTVTASYALEKIIKTFKKNQNIDIYFYTDEILASGGYWVATTGNKIYANYGSIIGSIGVSGPSWYYYDKPTSISSGIFGQNIENENKIQIFDQNVGNSKDLYNPFRKPTNIELKHLQNIITEIYNDFITKVSSSRKIEINTLKNEIGALIYTSNQAKKNFLIDDEFSYKQLIEHIKYNKKFADFKILKFAKKSNLLSNYLVRFNDINYSPMCSKISSSFVSLLPLYMNNC